MSSTETPDARSALVLLGGHSTRFGGEPKALAPWPQGPTVLDALLATLRAWAGEILLVGRPEQRTSHEREGCRWVDDADEDAGPCAGLWAGLDAMHTHWGMCVPCDVPGISIAVFERLWAAREGAVALAPCFEDQINPTVALYHREAQHTLRRALDERGVRGPSMRGVFEQLEGRRVPIDSRGWQSARGFNSRAEFAQSVPRSL